MQPFLIVMTILLAAAFAVLARYVRTELARSKTGDGLAGREAHLVELYGHVEELMDVFEAYIDEVRQDIEKERAELTELSRQAAVLFTRVLAEQKPDGEAAGASAQIRLATPGVQPVERSESEPPRIVRPVAPTTDRRAFGDNLSAGDREALGRFATKPQKVRFLMGRGLALEDVARALGIGTGEVRLIAELEK